MRRFAISLGFALVSLASFEFAAYAQGLPGSALPPERPYRVEQPSTSTVQPSQEAWGRSGQRGLEVQLGGGLMLPDAKSPVRASNLYPQLGMMSGDPTGDILTGKEAPYGPDPFGVRVAVGYRFAPWLSVGGYFTYANFAAKDGTDSADYVDGTNFLERQLWSIGLYGRYYLVQLHPRLQPWIELGVGYSQDNASYVRDVVQSMAAGPDHQQYVLEAQGITVPLTVGLDWRVAPGVSFGPMIGYSGVFTFSACASVSANPGSPLWVSNECKRPVTGSAYGVFLAGIFAKVTWNLGL
jgi:hypothetical protein